MKSKLKKEYIGILRYAAHKQLPKSLVNDIASLSSEDKVELRNTKANFGCTGYNYSTMSVLHLALFEGWEEVVDALMDTGPSSTPVISWDPNISFCLRGVNYKNYESYIEAYRGTEKTKKIAEKYEVLVSSNTTSQYNLEDGELYKEVGDLNSSSGSAELQEQMEEIENSMETLGQVLQEVKSNLELTQITFSALFTYGNQYSEMSSNRADVPEDPYPFDADAETEVGHSNIDSMLMKQAVADMPEEYDPYPFDEEFEENPIKRPASPSCEKNFSIGEQGGSIETLLSSPNKMNSLGHEQMVGSNSTLDDPCPFDF